MLIVLMPGCISIARISDFPKNANAIDFDKYSAEYTEKKQPFWTVETSNEFYFETNRTISDLNLIQLISESLMEQGYRIYSTDIDNKYIIGKRGLRANEWNTKTGVYYKINTEKKKTQIYINSRITQDITGGWKENRAKKVGFVLEKMINGQK